MDDAYALRVVHIPARDVIGIQTTREGNKVSIGESLLKPRMPDLKPLPSEQLPELANIKALVMDK
jgi:hypothetical protein